MNVCIKLSSIQGYSIAVTLACINIYFVWNPPTFNNIVLSKRCVLELKSVIRYLQQTSAILNRLSSVHIQKIESKTSIFSKDRNKGNEMIRFKNTQNRRNTACSLMCMLLVVEKVLIHDLVIITCFTSYIVLRHLLARRDGKFSVQSNAIRNCNGKRWKHLNTINVIYIRKFCYCRRIFLHTVCVM